MVLGFSDGGWTARRESSQLAGISEKEPLAMDRRSLVPRNAIAAVVRPYWILAFHGPRAIDHQPPSLSISPTILDVGNRECMSVAERYFGFKNNLIQEQDSVWNSVCAAVRPRTRNSRLNDPGTVLAKQGMCVTIRWPCSVLAGRIVSGWCLPGRLVCRDTNPHVRSESFATRLLVALVCTCRFPVCKTSRMPCCNRSW